MNHGWEKKRFDDCITKVKYPPKLQTKDYEDNGIYPIVSQEAGLINGYTNNASVIFKHRDPVVIFGDHTRCVKYVDFDFALGADGIKILSPIDGILPKFFAYAIRSLQIPSLGYARHYRLLRDNNVPIPSKEQQRAIVAELDAINEAIEVKRRQLKALDDLAQAIFYDTFGDPIANPKKWEITSIRDLILSKSEIARAPKLLSADDEISYIDISSIDNKRNIITNTSVYKVCKAPSRAQQIVTTDDILVGLVRPNLRNIAQIKSSETNLVASSGFIVCRASNKTTPSYLKYLFLSAEMTATLCAKIAGQVYPAITEDNLRSVKVGCPPLEFQKRFAAQVGEIERGKENVEATIARLQTLLDSRMDYWFND